MKCILGWRTFLIHQSFYAYQINIFVFIVNIVFYTFYLLFIKVGWIYILDDIYSLLPLRTAAVKLYHGFIILLL
jgi:hypothetical protein